MSIVGNRKRRRFRRRAVFARGTRVGDQHGQASLDRATRRAARGPGHRLRRPAAVAMTSACSLVWAMGCATAPAARMQLDPGLKRPAAAVMLISVDGFGADKFDEFLAAGDLPNIRRLLVDAGVRVRRAVASHPTITYANFTTILTGRYAGHHGILGNKWFDRYALIYRDYATMATYRWVGDDYLATTLFELVKPGCSVSIQCPNRRGATRTIDNWASSGIRWFFGALRAVDQLIPLRMLLIAEQANAWGQWPVLIHAYMPAVDETGHRHGADSPQYREAAINADRQVGLLVEAVEAAGMLDRTYFVFVSDHGHVPVPPERFCDVAGHLRRELGLKIQDRPSGITPLARRRRHYAGIDAVLIVGGDRRAVIHLPGRDGWHQRPDFARVEALLGATDRGGQPLWMHPAVELALVPRRDSDGSRTIEVYSRHGHSRLSRRGAGVAAEYGYEKVTGDALAGAVEAGWHDAEIWLALTADGPYPGLLVQIVELFDSPRAGDVMLVAAPGWDFAPGCHGGHGSVCATDVLVPMVFAGPGLPAGAMIDNARLVDVAPTILGLLAGHNGLPDGAAFDGVDRSAALGSARPAQDRIE